MIIKLSNLQATITMLISQNALYHIILSSSLLILYNKNSHDISFIGKRMNLLINSASIQFHLSMSKDLIFNIYNNDIPF